MTSTQQVVSGISPYNTPKGINYGKGFPQIGSAVEAIIPILTICGGISHPEIRQVQPRAYRIVVDKMNQAASTVPRRVPLIFDLPAQRGR